jgi:hypothetical protein
MMKSWIRLVPLAAVAVGALVFALVALGSSKHSTRASAKNASCYPGNEFTTTGGDVSVPNGPGGRFKAASTGSASKTSGATATWDVSVNVRGNNGAAFTYSAGSMTGTLKATWNLPSFTPKIKFVSRCIAEASLVRDTSGDTEIEAEFEGTIINPPWGGGPAPAVAFVTIETNTTSGSGPVVSFGSGAEPGTTCSEGSGFEFRPLETSDPAPSGTLTSKPAMNPAGEERARAGLPAPWTATNICPGVY